MNIKDYSEVAVDNSMHVGNEIDIKDLVSVIWRRKLIISLVTFIFALAAVFFALSLPNVYKSEVLVAPVSDNGGMKIPGQLGGLAALAGVNLGSLGDGDRTALAIEILKSRDFIAKFIERHNLLLPLMAADSWNRQDNTLNYDDGIYDTSTNEWVRVVKEPYKPKPSMLEAHEAFLKIFSVNQDKLTGMVKMSLMHVSPYIAKEWLILLTNDINQELKQRDITEAENSIAYLNKQIDQTNIADVRTTLYSLIEDQIKTLMLANVRDEYVFKVIDPAIAPEKKAKPRRALIVIFAALLGGCFSSIFFIISHIYRRDRH
ncbi:chain length determinant protein [Rheinheimera sp. A13L]|uniref:Wzz/FepE/Etk N-terminal domain-containing protein n=1 Tax=Rheinheimera sp. A13L TaxID=506534 RepID=UPI00021254B4|nr:Wzz/FepE/Etk N-terminal domain-containing protein [Rheinheimera sp. A13L]EGM78176.1 chain length determinant protein [Rheinheimera sp. A13L]